MSDAEERPSQRHSKPVQWLLQVLDELGILPVLAAPRDTKLLMLQRFIRLFAYGASTLILAAYLHATGVSESRVGLFMTLTLAGDVCISFLLTLIADALGRRLILALGAVLMAASGVVFALTQNYWILLLAAILGVITPSGNEIGPFRAVEESVIAHLTDAAHRPAVFAWYTLIGTLGTALGLVTCGWATTWLVERKGWEVVETYHLVFFVYAGIGGLKLVLTLLLSGRCEAEKATPPPPRVATEGERAPLLGEANGEANSDRPKQQQQQQQSKPSKFAMLPKLSRESRTILFQLCLLFALDNFASGLAPMSWVTYYFKRRFSLPESKIGTLFFVTSIISACSVLVAASIAKRIGNVKTMVFTHLPSSICLALVGIPSQLPLAMLLVVLRACTQSMDAAPRSAFLAAIVLPNERTATMGTVNVVKTISQSLGPLITGILVERELFWVAFLAAGSLKATYDVGMLLVFASHRTREEREAEQTAEGREALQTNEGREAR